MSALVAKEGNNNMDPIPEGVHTAVCCGVVDLGTQYSERFGKASRKAAVIFELSDCRGDVERNGKKFNLRRTIGKRYTVSLAPKANLRMDLEAWRGREFTPAELKGFDLKQLIAAGCQLQVIHNRKDSKIYANVGAIMALPKGVKAPTLENEPTFFTLDDLDETLTLPATMPDWQQNIIRESREWKELSSKASKYAGTQPRETAATDDDVPF